MKGNTRRLLKNMAECPSYVEMLDANDGLPFWFNELCRYAGEVEAEVERLQAIVDKLPKCWRLNDAGELVQDVPVVPGMRLFTAYNNGRDVTGFDSVNGRLTCLYFCDGFDKCCWSHYSTREAAEAAMERGE